MKTVLHLILGFSYVDLVNRQGHNYALVSWCNCIILYAVVPHKVAKLANGYIIDIIDLRMGT